MLRVWFISSYSKTPWACQISDSFLGGRELNKGADQRQVERPSKLGIGSICDNNGDNNNDDGRVAQMGRSALSRAA